MIVFSTRKFGEYREFEKESATHPMGELGNGAFRE
jgi:hypothetical protein